MDVNTQYTSFKILVVDDAPSSVRIVSEAICQLADVIVASNGEQALSLARHHLPNIILLDIQMPGIDGLQVCRELKSSPRTANITIIFVTADTQIQTELEAFSLGGIDYILKPINTAVLETRVRGHLTLIRRTQELTFARNTLANLIRTLPVFVSSWRQDLSNSFSNDNEKRWFPVASTDMLGKHISDCFPKDFTKRLTPYIDAVLAGEDQLCELDYIGTDGHLRYVQLSLVCAHPFQSEDAFVMVMTDISARKKEELALIKENEHFGVTLNSIGDGVIASDVDGNITFMNPIAERLTGWNNNEAIGCSIEQVMQLHDAVTNSSVTNPIRLALQSKQVVTMPFDTILVDKSGTPKAVEDSAAPIMDSAGELIGAIMVFHDLTMTRKSEARIAQLANFDNLTNLPNRILLLDRTEQAFKKAREDKTLCAMIMADIDNFERINNTHGYLVGDQLIVDVAEYIQEFLRDSDTLARPGGDEFTVLLTNIRDPEHVEDFCKRLLAGFEREWRIGDKIFNITVSLGTALFPNDSVDAQTLLRRSDTAMRESKRSGKNTYRFFSKSVEEHLSQQASNARQLRDAMANKEICVYYQPKVDAERNQITGCEALVRWKKPDGSMVYPNEFIPLAEQTKQIISLGKYVLSEACKQAVVWQRNYPDLTIAVNISAIQFTPTLVEHVREVLASTQLPAHTLELELTESTLINDVDATSLINKLKQLGIKLSMDDFGTGFSSLSYLKKFPIDCIKIDQSFVRGMLDDETDISIIYAVITLANRLGLSLVAEGVETEAHAAQLKGMGCLQQQGYFYSRPVDADAMTAILGLQEIVSPEV